MTAVGRKYDRKEFIDNGYEIFTKFMFSMDGGAEDAVDN